MFLDKALSKRTKDENGYLTVLNNPIAKAGVFQYLHSELFEDSTDDTIVNVYRDFKDLCKVKDTFADKPIVHNHQWVGEETNRVDGAMGSKITVDEENQTLNADLIFYNPDLIKAIEDGEDVELSPGYTGDIVEEHGMFNGQSYDYRQIPDYCNHMAVVKNGRAGKDLKIQDSKPKNQGDTMAKKVIAQSKSFSTRLRDSLRKILDEEAKTEVQDEEAQLTDSEMMVKIAEIAGGDMDEEAKLTAIRELLGSEVKAEDEDPTAEKTEDEDAVEKTEDEDAVEEKKTEDEDTAGAVTVTPEELAKVVAEAVEAKMAKFTDSQAKQAKRITDTYIKVSDALGTSFNYSGMSVDDIYKFGYESITSESLASGLNAQTAFTIATSKQRSIFKDEAPTQKDGKLSNLLKQY